MAEQSLKDKTVKGTFWSAADVFLGQGVTFFVGLVLARLLTPAEYGLIGICGIFISVLTGIVDCGFSNAIIRKKDVTNVDYNTMFITNMITSIALYVFLYCSSPYIAVFFHRQELVYLVRLMGLVLIFQALSITQVTILTKKIDFKTKTKSSLISAMISGIIGILMAFCGYGVLALVGQLLSKQLLYTICLWFYNKWWPKFYFNYKSFQYMWGFGWKLMLSGLLNNIWNQLYQVIVGKFYSPSTLGQYSRSKEYAGIFSSNVTSIIQRVSYPVLSEIQNEKERMVNAYRRMIKVTMFITTTFMIGLGSISEPLIYCLIGPQWHEASTYLPLICLSMSLYPLQSINLNMLQVQGRSDIFLYLEIVKKILAVGPICLGVFVNIYFMLVGVLILGVVSFFLNSYYTGKSLNYTSWMQIKDIVPSYATAIIIGSSMYFFKFLTISMWLILPIQVTIGIIVFVILNERLKLEEYTDIRHIVIDFIHRMK